MTLCGRRLACQNWREMAGTRPAMTDWAASARESIVRALGIILATNPVAITAEALTSLLPHDYPVADGRGG